METLKIKNGNYKEIDTSRKAGELTTEEAKKLVELVQDFDIFDSDYLYDLEEVKEEHRTNEQKQQTIDYLRQIQQATEGNKDSEELYNRINEIVEILKERIKEGTTASINKQAKKLGAILLPR